MEKMDYISHQHLEVYLRPKMWLFNHVPFSSQL